MRINVAERPLHTLCFELEKLIQKNHPEIDGILVGDLSHISSRAECYNGIEVVSVQYQDGIFHLSYSYDWFVYNGCSDMDEQDKVFESVTFSVENDGEVIFEIPERGERSTFEEF